MSEERKYVYLRKTRSGNGVRMRDGEIVYIASIRSIEAFLRGEREFVAFMRFPYRQIAGEEQNNDCVYTYCKKCGAGRVFRKVRENVWRCEFCGTEATTEELIGVVRNILESD